MTVRLARVQQGFGEALQGAADVVTWAYGQQPRGVGSLLLLTLTSGPATTQGWGKRARTVLPADSVVLRVPAVMVGTRLAVTINGWLYTHDVAAGETQADARDGLMAEIATGEAGIVTPSSDGADGIELAADFLGALRDVKLYGGLGYDDPATISGDAVEVTEGTERMLVTLQAYSRGREPSNGALALVNEALGTLRKDSALSTLLRHGVSLRQRGAPQDLTAVAGADWETRCAVDVTAVARSVDLEPVEFVEQVNASITHEAFTVQVNAAA